MGVELVEDEDAAVAEQLVHGPVHRGSVPVRAVGVTAAGVAALGVRACGVVGDALVQPAEEVVEVQPPFARGRQAVEEGVHQPALAAADRAPEVEVARRAPQPPGRVGQLVGEPAEPLDRRFLGGVEGEPALLGGAQEVRAHRLVLFPRPVRHGSGP